MLRGLAQPVRVHLMSTPMVIAADGGRALAVLGAPALAIVAVLIGAVVWGSRRVRRRRSPVPTAQALGSRAGDAVSPERDSWQTPGPGPDPAARPGGPGRHRARRQDTPGPPQ
ncbi:hypothetical protein GCM10009665_37630 [Kitasatospora nipponensis]|uniref:Uncharacterized protein n=1 Tax=Kitasatospora nipponensis TaxID=258049 RepID=A0ABN1WB28_9ACTN